MAIKKVKVSDIWPEPFDCNLKNKKTILEIIFFINDSIDKIKEIKTLCFLGFTLVEIRHGIESIIHRIQKSTKGSKEIFQPSIFFKKLDIPKIEIPEQISQWFKYWTQNVKKFNDAVETLSKDSMTKTQLVLTLSLLSYNLMFLINMCKSQAKQEEINAKK